MGLKVLQLIADRLPIALPTLHLPFSRNTVL
jgi:hypothetical protein